MSITNFIHKIKSKSGIDKNTLMFLFIIIGVGISSFGLGRLSIDRNIENSITDFKNTSQNLNNINDNINILNSNSLNKESSQDMEKRYVASKNGKMYYVIGCSGASRIKDENKIWFATSEDAEKSGFTYSSTCK